jgi:hypothetical protein
MTGKERKKIRIQLERLTRPQLVALVTQRDAMPYQTALASTQEALVDALLEIEGVLVPVKA